MLNDADSYQGGDQAGGGEAAGKVKDADALFSKLKRNVKADYNSKGHVNWRKEVQDFDFDAGEQSTRKIRRSCRTQGARSSFSTA